MDNNGYETNISEYNELEMIADSIRILIEKYGLDVIEEVLGKN